MSDHLYQALYDYYHDDMPYGIKKARAGDPYEWVSDRFYDDLHDHGMVDEASVQVRKVRTPNMVQAQGIPNPDMASWKFNDDPLPHTELNPYSTPQGPDISLPMTDLDSSPMPHGPDLTSGEPFADEVGYDGKWIPRIHMSGVGKTHDDDEEPVNECNYTMENEYCPVHGLEECYGSNMFESELARIKSLSSFK
jgi:hypothetical protein